MLVLLMPQVQSSGMIPRGLSHFCGLMQKYLQGGCPRLGQPLNCAVTRRKKREVRKPENVGRKVSIGGAQQMFPLAGRKTLQQKQPHSSLGVNFTRNTNSPALDGTWISTGMSQCLDILPIATGRKRACLQLTTGKQSL